MAYEALELIQREKPPDGYARLTVEVASRYRREFYDEMKRVLPRGAWFYDYDGSEKWFIMPEYIQQVAELALKHFDKVWLVKGERRTDFRTNETIEQGSFF